MIRYTMERLTLAVLGTAVVGLLSTTVVAAENDESWWCCCGGSRVSERERLMPASASSVNSRGAPPQQPSILRTNPPLEQQPAPSTAASTVVRPAPTPSRLSAEPPSAASRSRAESTANSDEPKNQFQANLLEMRRSGKLKKSVWNLLTDPTWGNPVHGAIQQLIEELQDPNAVFDISVQMEDTCEIEYTTKGQKLQKMIELSQ